MRVLMVNYEYPPLGGGGGQAHEALLKEYAQMEGLEADVVTSKAGGSEVVKMEGGVRLYKVGIRKPALHYWRKSEVLAWLWKAGRVYKRLLRENAYDVGHAFFGFPSGWLSYRSRRVLPYVVSLRGSDVPGGNARLALDYKLLGGVFRRIWKGAAAVVANSEGLRERAQRFAEDVAIEVIGQGVDQEMFAAGERGGPGEVVRLLTVGRLSGTKRVEVLLEMVKVLEGRGVEARLTVAGDGALRGMLEERARELGVKQKVRFTGRLERATMPGVYAGHDVYVSATAQEGMSNAMLEAMASGQPIVTTRCEGVEELIGENGIVVEEARAEELARAVEKVMREAGCYEAMSAAAVRRAEGFTWRAVSRDYVRLYERIRKKRISGEGGGDG